MKFKLLVFLFYIFTFSLSAQNNRDKRDVFVPLSKYIEKGEVEKLSAWFASTIELDIKGKLTQCSKFQAIKILNLFFNEYTPKTFEIKYKSGRAPLKYAVGNLSAGGENFDVILYVRISKEGNKLQQLKIRRKNN